MKSLTPDQTESVGELLAAEAKYLRDFDWIPMAPVITGAPVFWMDPIDGINLAQDRAIEIQKSRVVDILYRNYR